MIGKIFVWVYLACTVILGAEVSADDATGDLIGRVAELEGVGRGLRLLEDSGSFIIVVGGREVQWEVEVSQLSKDRAAILTHGVDVSRSLAESSLRLSRRVLATSFTEWRPQGDDGLLLFDDGDVVGRISFLPACPRLSSAASISFVTPADNGLDNYDSILLVGGTRCYFHQVVPFSIEEDT